MAVQKTDALFVTITAYYALSLQEYHMTPHTHSSAEIMYVTGGSCQISGPDFTSTLTAGQFVFFPPYALHCLKIIPESPCTILNLEFSVQTKETALPLSELLANCPGLFSWLSDSADCTTAQDQRNMGYAMKDLITQLQKKQEDAYLLRLLFSRVMLEFFYCVTHDRRTAGALYIQKACSYIEENLTENLTIPSIAAYTGVNKSYLQLLFSQLMGCSIGSYVTKKRLELAAFLLTNSSLSITDTAFSVGYNSRQHFTHAFEKQYQISPSAYRNLHSRPFLPDTEYAQHRFDENGKEFSAPM